jgi:hypothetical protein
MVAVRSGSSSRLWIRQGACVGECGPEI